MATPAPQRDLRPVDRPEPATEGERPASSPPDAATPPSTPSRRTRMAGLQGAAIVVVGVAVFIGALKAAAGFFVPIAFGIVFALALAPIVRVLDRAMPRWVASGLVVCGLVVGAAAMAYTMSDEATQAIAELPRATRALRQTFRTITNRSEGALSQIQRAARELQQTATESTDRPATPSGVTAVQVVEPPIDFNNFVWFGSQGILAVLGQFTLIVFLVYFLLASGDLFKRKLVLLSGETLTQRKVTVQVIDQIGARVAKSLSHLILAGVLVGLTTWGMLAFFGVRYAGLWGLVAGLLNCVPYLGPAVVAAALLLAGLLQFGDISVALLIAGVSLVITTIEGSLFTPIVFGRAVALNPVAVFVSFLFWGWLWGIAGMLLALPLLMIVKTIAESVEDLAPLAELLSD
jgi:predicted PurR-regulated permease PerM